MADREIDITRLLEAKYEAGQLLEHLAGAYALHRDRQRTWTAQDMPPQTSRDGQLRLAAEAMARCIAALNAVGPSAIPTLPPLRSAPVVKFPGSGVRELPHHGPVNGGAA